MAMACGKIEIQNTSLYISYSWGSPGPLPTYLESEGIHQDVIVMQMFSTLLYHNQTFKFFLLFSPYIFSLCQKKSILWEAPQLY